ncbi:MAG TPA: glycosyltransferase family 9 protein [Micavibrio sp.]
MEKHILFITSNRLGDAVLSTGLLNHILRTEPDARVTVACGFLPSTLFEGYPALAEIVPFKKEKYSLHWARLWRRLAGRRWDRVIDLRNSAVSRLIPARRRFIYGPHIDQDLHKVEQAARTMGLPCTPAPALWFTAAQRAAAERFIPDGGPVLGIGPTANWAGKIWPAERFIALIKILTGPEGILPDARIAVFAAPGEESQALPVFESIPPERRIDMIAKADPGTAAAALARCDLYVGHDSGLMHCAAAAGTPTVGLFGPSWPHLYGPWGDHTAFVSTPETYDELIAFDGYDSKTTGSLMTTLSVESVEDGVRKFWAKLEQRAFKCRAL